MSDLRPRPVAGCQPALQNAIYSGDNHSCHLPFLVNLHPMPSWLHDLCSLQEKALLTASVGICSACRAGLGLGSLKQMQVCLWCSFQNWVPLFRH